MKQTGTRKVYMNVTSGDIHVQSIKITSVLSSSVVLLGDTESIVSRSTSISRGVLPQKATPVGGVVGPGVGTGAIGNVPV